MPFTATPVIFLIPDETLCKSRDPLSTVATLQREQKPTLIERVNGKRVVYVNGYYRKDGPASMDLSMAIAMRAGSKLNFPPGYGIDSMGKMILPFG